MSNEVTVETIRELLHRDKAAAAVGLIELLMKYAGHCKISDNGFCYEHGEDFPCLDELVRWFNEDI